MTPLERGGGVLRFEKQAWASGCRRVAGVDEAGRGPWAGPVVAAAVVFDPEFALREARSSLKGLTDSKRLSAAERERFFDLLTHSGGVAWAIGEATPEEIDAWNILRATHRAMARALAALEPPPEFALVDGRPAEGLPCPARALIRGDARSLSIAAASVIAKVTRDRFMGELDRQYPQYGFARHKGYGTPEHRRALRAYGPLPVHRRSFEPVRQLTLWNLP